MIISCIKELLYDHECVIIPGFGAFISKETPATLDYVNHRLTPPSKELAFNGQLIADDGLLIGYLAKRMGITGKEAAKMIHEFAMSSMAVLEASGVLRLDGMGVLSRVTERDYHFKLDGDMNLLGDAFGLSTFTAQPIYRRETYQQIAKKINTEQKPHQVTRHNYKWFRAAAYSMVVAMFLVLIGWGADKSGYDIASWNPFFYSSPNEFIAKHLSSNIEPRVFASVDRMPAKEASMLDLSGVLNYIQPVDVELLRPVDVRVYYIVGSSLKNQNDANRCVNSFKKKGFENAEALPVNSKGNIRVAYESVMGYDAALKRLEIIKKEYNEAAWLLRKK